MSYQPLQLPHNMGVNAGLDQLTSSLGDLANWKREQARNKAEQARLGQQDQRLARADATQALAEARALAAKGDFPGAQSRLALAGTTGLNFQDPDAERQQLQQELGIGQPGAPAQPPQPPGMGGSAVPDQVDQGRKLPAVTDLPQDAQGALMMQMLGRAPMTPESSDYFKGVQQQNQDAGLEALMGKAAPGAAPAPSAPPPQGPPQGLEPPPFMPPGQGPAAAPMAAPGPGPQAAPPPPQSELDKLLAANNGDIGQAVLSMRNNQQGQRAEQARRLITGKLNGVDISIDPDAERNYASKLADADRQRQAGALNGAFGDQYSPMAVRLIQAGVDPQHVGSIVSTLMEKQAAEKQRAEDKKTALEQQAELRREGITQSDVNNKRLTQAMMASAGIRSQADLRASQGVGSDQAKIEGAFKDFKGTVDWNKLQAATRQLDIAKANVEGNALNRKDSMVALARAIRGSTPSEGEMHLLYNNLGGRLKQALPQLLADMESGDITPDQKALLSHAIDTTRDEIRTEQVGHVIKAAKHRFGPGSGYENYAPQVNALTGSMFDSIGLHDTPPVFGESGPVVPLGEGNPLIKKIQASAPKKPAAATPSGSSHAEVDDFLKSIGH